MRNWLIGGTALLAVVVFAVHQPFPAATSEQWPWLWLISQRSPLVWGALVAWHYLMPCLWVVVGLRFALAQRDIWTTSSESPAGRTRLPPWPLNGREELPAIVVGEQHHPVEPIEFRDPRWLTIPAKGLFTGTAVFGAVGSGKTSACIIPWTRQLLGWQATDRHRRCSGLVLEVKGSMCPMIQRILEEHDRSGDWVELGLGDDVRVSWNPLDVPEMDAFSLAYQLASFTSQLYGKGKEPFWQQATTNVFRNVILLFRIDPTTGGWVTLVDLNDTAVSRDGIGRKIQQVASRLQATSESEWVRLRRADLLDHADQLVRYREQGDGTSPSGDPVDWSFVDGDWAEAAAGRQLVDVLQDLGVDFRTVTKAPRGSRPHRDAFGILEEVNKWYVNDWMELDEKTRSNVVAGISVFLGMFTPPDIKRVLAPPAPRTGGVQAVAGVLGDRPIESVLKPLPRMRTLIESGKVIGMNLPSSTNPALARVFGVMLKQAWLQAAMERAADMGSPSEQYPADFFYRPALFLCDEYHMFATVGASDPCGDEKAFSLTRESRVMPVIATQSIPSLKSVCDSQGQDVYKTLLQALRTKVFLSLSDEESCSLAAKMAGKAEMVKKQTQVSEDLQKGGVNFLTGASGGSGGKIATSYTYIPEFRDIFERRVFGELALNEGICLPFDGNTSHSPTRVYLKPSYRPVDEPYFRWRESLGN